MGKQSKTLNIVVKETTKKRKDGEFVTLKVFKDGKHEFDFTEKEGVLINFRILFNHYITIQQRDKSFEFITLNNIRIEKKDVINSDILIKLIRN